MGLDENNKIQLKAFGLGQLISVVITGTGVCSELLAFKYAGNNIYGTLCSGNRYLNLGCNFRSRIEPFRNSPIL